MDRLKKLRDRIDWLDTQIASLLNERMRAADQVGNIKKSMPYAISDPLREKRVLNQVERMVQHPVLKANVSNIYREIMQESRCAQQFFRYLSQPFRRIGIIGMGLMGGSICKSIKTKDASVEINTLRHHSEDIHLAQAEGWVDHVYETLRDLIQNSELIILASPISTIVELAEQIKFDSFQIKKLIVIDIASVKEKIVETFEALSSESIEYVSTHPMAGKENGGFVNAQATLFVNRPWIVVPHQKNSAGALERIQELILFLGSEPLCLEAEVHDRQAALVSHLPSILSKVYLDFVRSLDPESLKIAGPGFQTFTRLAHDNSSMRAEIATYNHTVIYEYLDQLLEYLIKIRGPKT